jgi:hypothetical protein
MIEIPGACYELRMLNSCNIFLSAFKLRVNVMMQDYCKIE